MTGRTHDLAAFTALSFVIATHPIPQITFATALTCLSATFVGGLAPDIDQPTANLWNRIPAGGIWGRMLTPILGGHRFISHSILGIILFGVVLKWILTAASSVVLVNMDLVWWSFMIGFVSHLLMDTITRDGVFWLFPLPIRIGFPPFRFMRIKTGGMVEKSIIFPLLMVLNVVIYYQYHQKLLETLKQYIK